MQGETPFFDTPGLPDIPQELRQKDVMPYSREPLKTLYVVQRLMTTLFMVPWWVVYYGLLPRSRRPRSSWSIKQIITVNFTRRVYKVTEKAGVTWGTRNPEKESKNSKLKETRFQWVDPLAEELRTGVVADSQVPFKRVGTFVWPRSKRQGCPSCAGTAQNVSETTSKESDDIEAHPSGTPVIGIFLHGGGYCHMSAHEKSKTSKIPRRLIKDKVFTEIHAVEYRLLQHAPFPAALQDAAAVYAKIIRDHSHDSVSLSSSSSGTSTTLFPGKEESAPHASDLYLSPNFKPRSIKEEDGARTPLDVRASAIRRKHCKIILIGDSAGGNLVLGLARWIRDQAVLPPPDGLLLLSPSCDPSHAFPEAPSSYVPRPHADVDYLVDTPEPRALLQRMLLGHNTLDTIHSPYLSPASLHCLKAFYGDMFAHSAEDITIRALDEQTLQQVRAMASVPATPTLDYATPRMMGGRRRPPIRLPPRGLSLFTDFPKTCVVLGDAERLEREVMRLIMAFERDAVRVRTIWVEDAVHDVLMMGWWDEKVIDRVWGDVKTWIEDVVAGRVS